MARLAKGLKRGDDGIVRCFWPGSDPLYVRYHDREWGFPVSDDQRLFEKICLEGFQSGLSWLTILRKRDNFRNAFKQFDFHAVARYRARDVNRLLKDAGIVRHRGKIEAAIQNARCACDLLDSEGSIARYVWSFEPGPRERPRRLTRAVLRKLTETKTSRALAADLRTRGWRFVGPTTVYAFMQAVGLVNDHLDGCAVRDAVETSRQGFRRP